MSKHRLGMALGAALAVGVAAGGLRAGEPAPGTIWTEPATGIAFVWIPGGRFAMGCNPAGGRCPAEESPPHRVTVRGFWLSRTEITQGQWRRLMSYNPSSFRKGDDYPVDQVHWQDAKAFIASLNRTGHGRFRLPSEAEWEYACRAGHPDDPYCGGTDPKAVAWYLLDTVRTRSTMPVGRKAANAFGLFDMSGNLWEWTADCWVEGDPGAPADGRPRSDKDCLSRVLRGGSWGNYPAQLRASARRSDTDVKCPFIGLRLVRDPG